MTASASESTPSNDESKRTKWVANVRKFIVSTPSSGQSENKVESGRDHHTRSQRSVPERESPHQSSSTSSKTTSKTTSSTSKTQHHEIVIVTCAPCLTTPTSERTMSRREEKRSKLKKGDGGAPKNIRYSSTISSSRETTPYTTSSKRPDDTTQATSSCWSLTQNLSTKSIGTEGDENLSTFDDDPLQMPHLSISSVKRNQKDASELPPEETRAPDPPLGLARPTNPTQGQFVTCFPQYDECPRNAPLPPWLHPGNRETEPESETIATCDPNCGKTSELSTKPIVSSKYKPPKTSPPEFNPWHEVDSKIPYSNLPTWEDDFPGGLPYDQCHMEFPTDESQFI